MRAAVFTEPGEPMEIRDVDRPSPPEDGVVVETAACGVCRSDWHAWKGDWDWLGIELQDGQILGHEPAGTVVEVGEDVERFSEGDRVTNPFNFSEGACPYCRAGRANICEHTVPMGFVEFAQGAYAEEYPVMEAEQNLVTLPDNVDPVAVAGLGCRFATAFHGVAHRVDVDPGDWVAVHGCGGVGLSAVHIAEALGANVVAVDLDEASLEKAEELGADETVNAADVDNVAQEAKAATGQKGADISIDALGIAETCRNAIASLRKGGQHLQIGLTTSEEGGEVSLPVDRMVGDEIEFYGSYGMPPHEYDEIFRMMERGKLDPGAIVSETVSLDEVPETIASMDDFETVGIPVCNEF